MLQCQYDVSSLVLHPIHLLVITADREEMPCSSGHRHLMNLYDAAAIGTAYWLEIELLMQCMDVTSQKPDQSRFHPLDPAQIGTTSAAQKDGWVAFYAWIHLAFLNTPKLADKAREANNKLSSKPQWFNILDWLYCAAAFNDPMDQ